MRKLELEMEYTVKLAQLAAVHLQIAVENMRLVEVYCNQMEKVCGVAK